jgi:DNA-binding MarR family transcriptional regulator/N-acetylglutamate synthase-like GNAT family acetyltransferase
MSDMDQGRVATVRSFNRFYTSVIGLLSGRLLETPYTLTEARVIFELAQSDVTDVPMLRQTLGLDAGYLSRVLGRLETRGLLRREQSKTDARRQRVRLTAGGRRAFRTLDGRSAAEVAGLLDKLTDEEQRALVSAMARIQQLLEGSRPPQALVLRPPHSGDFGWVVHRHGVIYAQEYGWDETFEALVARIVADFVDHRDLKREAAWIAELDGDIVGCVFCAKKEESVAQLRLLLVEPRARGKGVGTRLCDQCVRFARSAGYERLMLWTNDVLEDARRIYERAGFELVEEKQHRSFGHDLVGQNWCLTL